ncbi:MAG: D-Ala-D-Ala carboxypeptidase family metallohydrolase [Marinomonas gallaica]
MMFDSELNPWPWSNFSRKEMQCKETGECRMIPSFMDRLQKLRLEFNKPMVISSGYRSRQHSIELNKKRIGTHAMGCAVDVVCSGSDALRLIELALQHGFTGIGVKQHSDINKRFIHLDDAPNATHRPRPWLWSYK